MRARLLASSLFVATTACLLESGPTNAATVQYFFSGIITEINCNGIECGNPQLTGPGAAALGTRFSGQWDR
jgi:hypothetical protein